MEKSSKFSAWINAFRLRTLPLALSSILLGSFLAAYSGAFSWSVAILAASTTLLLQILSNLANDYGDGIKGTDNEARVGPKRTIQSGLITHEEMRKMIVVFVFLTLISGIALLFSAFEMEQLNAALLFLILGIVAIASAIKYTVGKSAYGYHGLGDLFVFLFFGLTGVAGTYYLHTQTLNLEILLAGAAVGFLSSGVLNLNNMRDRKSDAQSGKNTLVVKIGSRAAKVYHVMLLVGALLSTAVCILLLDAGNWAWIFLAVTPLLARNVIIVVKSTDPSQLDPLLKQLALTTLLFVLLFGVGVLV